MQDNNDFNVSKDVGTSPKVVVPEPAVVRSTSSAPVSSVRWIYIMFVAAFFGLVGGYVAQITDTPAAITKLLRPQSSVSREYSETSQRPVLSPEDQTIVRVVEESAPAVVSIVITKDVPKARSFFGFPFFRGQSGMGGEENQSTRQTVGHGSGFFVSPDGYIVTNKHVVSDTKAEYTVITSDRQEFPATVLALDPVNDVAIIKVNGDAFPALRLGDSDALRVGQTALAIGNPLGEFANSVSRGIVSGLKRQVTAGISYGQEEVLRDIIQTDAAINPGNSGGPLLNLSGEVIGINVAVVSGAENIGFAIPVNQIKRAVDEVKQTGKIVTPYIGVRYIILNEALARQAGLPFTWGALIQRGEQLTDLAVIPGSPADKAGLVENDIILEIDGQKIDSEHSLASIIGAHRVGDTVKLRVFHKGDEKNVSVTLEERKVSN